MKKYHSIPMRMQIETIFGCNAHCEMCPIDMPSKRKKRSMDFILFKKVIDKRESKKTHLPVFLVNVASKQNQIMLPIGLAVLVNSLRYHNIEPQLIDLQIIDTEKCESFLRETLPKEQAIYGFGIIAGNYHLPKIEKYERAKTIYRLGIERMIPVFHVRQ